jgi:hypothetical protein
MTWLCSRWTCIFGRGCHGIIAGKAGEGCCSHGAFFTDADDERRVRKAAKRLTPQTWQHYRRGFKNYTEMDSVDGTTPARRTATRPDGPCVFLNDPAVSGRGRVAAASYSCVWVRVNLDAQLKAGGKVGSPDLL